MYGQALKSFKEGAHEIEGEIGPKDYVQDDACAAHGVEGAEVENQDRGLCEEDGWVVDDLDGVIELSYVSIGVCWRF